MITFINQTLSSNKDVFLAELILTASDLFDTVRFDQNDNELIFALTLDRINKTFEIKDNGVGMKKAELVKNLATIAKSGTTKFMVFNIN